MKFISIVLFILCSALFSGTKTVAFASDFQLYPFQSYEGDIYKFYIVNWIHYVNQTKSNTNDLLKLIELNSDSSTISDGDKKIFENFKIKLENLERKVINEHNKVFLNGLTQLTKSLRRIHGGHVKVCNVMEINRGDGGSEKCLKLNEFCELESIEDGLVQCVKSLLLENFNGLLEYTFALASFYDGYTTGSVDDSTLYDYFDAMKSSSNLIHKSFLECTIDAVQDDEQRLQIIQVEEKSCFTQS